MTVPLKIIFWETTSRCNLSCWHCRRPEVFEEEEKELTTLQAKYLMESIRELGKPIVVLSGGEPLLRGDIFEIAAHALSLGLSVALATNGTLIDEDKARRIKESGINRVSVSLDGADASTHDKFRREAGSFEKALSGIRELQRAGIEYQINATITRHNVNQIGAMHELANEIGAGAFHIFMLVPVGCGAVIPEEERLTPGEYERALNEFYEISSMSKIQTKATCAPQYYRIIAQRKGKPKSGVGMTMRGCLAGYAVCFVSSEGEVYPCGYLPVSAGNVLREKFKDIWNDSKVFGELRDLSMLKGKCGRCEYRSICMGCRARAYARSGDYLAEEQECIYEPGTRGQKK